MQLLAEASTTIRCSVDQVFALISDMQRFAEWFPGVIDIVSVDTLPVATLGKRYRETVSIPLRGKQQIEIEVKEVEVGRRFVTEGNFPPLLPRMEILLEGLGVETHVQWAMYSRNNARLVRVLLLPLVRPTLQRRAQLGVDHLKSLLESAPR
ncbi:SRPBCC family protein [Pseudomonas sp. BMS12]|uniref:SRPBCC family protein n=1 Tax=Pseudomonas sp. BMS12 TaxID=1796033 RepID=UPI00083A9079|nr:SRPBCC family protein [Pseudomonas sp. BMS12]